MKTTKEIFAILFSVCLAFLIFTACDEGNDEDDEEQDDTNENGGDNGNNCATMPDMIVNAFTFYNTNGFYGTDFSFTGIEICNMGGTDASANSLFGFYLVVNADFSGDYYIVEKSSPLVGFSAGDCLTFTLNTTSSEAPEGYYYVYIVADCMDDIAECNETNNWARSQEAVYVKPDETEPV